MSDKKIMNSNAAPTPRDLLQALGALADAKTSPKAKAEALDLLVGYFDAEIEKQEKAPPRESASAATLAALNGRTDALHRRLGNAELASATARVNALQARATAPVDFRIELIQRCERNTMQTMRGGRK